MVDVSYVPSSFYRQVVPQHYQSNKWKEILINPKGASTTLSDESTLPRSGGHRFKDIPNRFIFWRVLYDKLELIEQSLDTNLAENQVRIHFCDAPILDSGISVYETSKSVVLLVPTVCSCHRFTFPRPNRPENDGQNESVSMDASIFSNFNVPSIDDPATFYFYSAEPSHPYMAASCLDQKHDAIFIIALQNNAILYIRMEYISGLSTLKEICQESAVPRILSNITKVFSTHIENPVIDSLVIHPFEQDLYVYSLNDACELKVWSIDKSVYIHIMDMKKMYAPSIKNGSRPHVIHKRFDGNLLLTVYLNLSDSSRFVVLEPCSTIHGMFKLKQKFYKYLPMTSKLVDMALYDEEIWCIWRTGKDVVSINSVNIINGEWKDCIMDTTDFEPPNQYLSNPKEKYLNMIFLSATYFTEDDLKNAIAVHDTSDNSNFVTNYYRKISNIIDKKISQEMDKYDSTDIESQMQLIEQCSASFYKSCLDYRRKRLAPLGLIWLGYPTSLFVVVTHTSFCFLRPTDNVENEIFFHQSTKEKTQMNNLMEILMLKPSNKFNKFLNINIHKDKFLELVKQYYTFNNGDPKIVLFFNEKKNKKTIRTLVMMLHSDLNKSFENTDNEYSECFRSKLGTSVISHSFHQLILTRFDLCCRLYILMELNCKRFGQNKEFIVDAINLVCNYWVLALFSHNVHLCEKMIATNKLLITQPFMDYVNGLLNYIWPMDDGSVLAKFLLQEGQYNFMQQMAILLDFKNWEETLVTSFLLRNDPDRALLVLKNELIKDAEHCLKVVALFEKHGYYEHAIQLGQHALKMSVHGGDENMISMFYSNIFLNNLKLKNYIEAFNNILSFKDQDWKLNCLHTFVLTLLENGEKGQLLEFNFCGLQGAMEDIVLKKARSLSTADATPFYMFLCSMHDKYMRYKKLAMTFYELYVRADTCIKQEEYLRLSLLYLESLDPKEAWFVTKSMPFHSKTSIVHNGLVNIDHVKKLCWLAHACQQMDGFTTETDLQRVVSALIEKHKYKEVLRLSKIWNLAVYHPLRALVKTCLTLTDPEECKKAWIWLVDNEVTDCGVDTGKIAWRFLETMVNKYEENGKTLVHYHVADELLTHRAFLPYWLIKTFKERNVSELLQLYLSYGELINCADLVFELMEKEISGDECGSTNGFGETIPVDIIECLIANLKHHKLQVGDELSNKYEIFCDQIARQENGKIKK